MNDKTLRTVRPRAPPLLLFLAVPSGLVATAAALVGSLAVAAAGMDDDDDDASSSLIPVAAPATEEAAAAAGFCSFSGGREEASVGASGDVTEKSGSFLCCRR